MCAREKGNLLSAGKRGVRFLMFLCGVQTSTVQSGEWRRSELQYRQRRDDEPLVEPVTALMKLWFSCMKRLNVGVFSSFQFTTKQKYPAVLDKQKHPAVLVQPKLGGEGLFCPLMTYPSFYCLTVLGYGLQTSTGSGKWHLISPLVTCYFLFPCWLCSDRFLIRRRQVSECWYILQPRSAEYNVPGFRMFYTFY